MEKELIKIPSYNKVLEAVKEFYGVDIEIDEIEFLSKAVMYSLRVMNIYPLPHTLNIKASTFSKPIDIKFKASRMVEKLCYLFIEELDEDNHYIELGSTNFDNYKASPNHAFSFNPISKEFKKIENE